VFYGILTPLSTLFEETYKDLDETKIGLCFLGIGGGMAVATVVNGKVLDWEYRRISKIEGFDVQGKGKENPDFPIERVSCFRQVQYRLTELTNGCVPGKAPANANLYHYHGRKLCRIWVLF
jgi:hypothetical protein